MPTTHTSSLNNPSRPAHTVGWLRSQLLPWLILAVSLSITYQSWKISQQNAEQALQTQFDYRVRDAVDDVSKRMKTYEQVMRGMDGLFSHASTIERGEFRDYVAALRLKENYPGIQGIRFVPIVPKAMKDQHIAAARKEGLPAYTIWPESQRDIYAPVAYVEPFDERNQQVFGYDMLSDLESPRSEEQPGIRHAAMEQARDSGNATLSGKIALLFETDKDRQAGFVMFLPLYKHDAPHDTVASRRTNIIGWIGSVFRVGDLMSGILGEHADIDIEIYDGKEASDKTMMYDSHPSILHQNPRFRSFQRISIADRTWTIGIHSLTGFEAQLDKEKPRTVAAIGTIASLFLTLLIWLLVSARARALQAAAAVERASRKNDTLLRTASDGIYILDLNGNVVQVNDAFCRMLGYTKEEMLTMNVAQWNTQWSAAKLKEVLANLKFSNPIFETMHRRRDGSIINVEISAAKVEIDGQQLIYNSARDITERFQAQKKLLLLSRAVENSPATVVITDPNGTIEYVNKKFTAITGYSLEEAIGQNPRILKSGRQTKEFYAQLWKTILAGNEWHGELYNKKKNGEIFLEQASISPIMDEHGAISNFVAVKEDITDKRKSEEVIWRQANFDPLTGLPNRRMFRDRMEQEIRKANRAGLPMALMFIDLDHFKEINDTLGHDMGDLLLIEAARRIGDCVRATDIVARLGGDEFTVLLAELDDIGSVERIATCITQKLATPFQLKDEVSYVSASIGITLYPNDADTIEGLFKHADQAMYVAKNQGRNRHSYFTHAMQEAAQARLRLINDLRGALAGNQFMVYFQPIVDMATGCINKAEALIRWQHPERGLVSPAEFIPLAEETGLIFEIGDWVFHESMRWAKRWRALHNPSLQISVNKSPVQFYKDGDDHSAWLSHLRKHDLPGQSIAIEITEGLLLDSNISITGALITLRDAGIQVSIDDFGTGYSSLSYLKKFHIDYLKIDRSFVRDLVTDQNDLALSEAIIVMAHKLGIKVVAEGVETKEQRDLLVAAGCDYAQGYWYSRPVPPEEFERLLEGVTSA